MKVLYPGTFDPPTKGHLNILERASALFDDVVIAIGINPKKRTVFSKGERLEFLKTLTKPLSNVRVASFDGLIVNFAKECGAHAILRSVRTFDDYEEEKTLAQMNQTMSAIETLFLFPNDPYQSLSSSLIREIAVKGEPITPFIPESIASAVAEKLQEEPRSDHLQ